MSNHGANIEYDNKFFTRGGRNMYISVLKSIMPETVLGFSIKNSDGATTMLINSRKGVKSGKIQKASRREICKAGNYWNEEREENEKDNICKHDY